MYGNQKLVAVSLAKIQNVITAFLHFFMWNKKTEFLYLEHSSCLKKIVSGSESKTL